jgi:hypothetical protein
MFRCLLSSMSLAGAARCRGPNVRDENGRVNCTFKESRDTIMERNYMQHFRTIVYKTETFCLENMGHVWNLCLLYGNTRETVRSTDPLQNTLGYTLNLLAVWNTREKFGTQVYSGGHTGDIWNSGSNDDTFGTGACCLEDRTSGGRWLDVFVLRLVQLEHGVQLLCKVGQHCPNV